jgi:hypothetical protein
MRSRRILAVVGGAVVLLAIIVVAFVADGATQGGTPEQQLRAWVTTTQVGQSIGTLHDDANNVTVALARHDGNGVLHTLCAGLQDDAQTANGNLPSPDTELTQVLAQAYRLEYNAGGNCYRAGGSGGALDERSAGERISADRLLIEALARIQDVTGQIVSTTTTTQPGSESIFG